ncbi:MAG: restriction endonuclease subunit S [Actinomycetia bacterium]|nr:restriction endonuclease subunit S [Actinomycetes bacterium]
MRWPVKPLGDVAETALGKMLDKGKDTGRPRVQYLRNVNVQWGRIDTDDLLTMELADGERERFEVKANDLLVCEGGEIGRCAVWSGRSNYIAFQKALHRIRPSDLVEVRFLRYLLEHQANSGALARLATGSTIAHLPQQQLRKVPVPLPPPAEQRRIVDLLEDHLSRLDAANRNLDTTTRRLGSLRQTAAIRALTGSSDADRIVPTIDAVGTSDGDLASLPSGWSWMRLGAVADVVGGVTKDSKKQNNPSYVEVPYLRVANVQRGQLTLDAITRIRVPPVKANALRLKPGDVLLNEGGDRDKLARGWVWEGQISNCIHQNHVFRARVTDPRLDPYFLSWTANTFGGRWAERNGKQSVNLASISLSMIRKMPVIVPPLGEAERIAGLLRECQQGFDRIADAVRDARRRADVLRNATLAAAFSGRLTAGGSFLEEQQPE